MNLDKATPENPVKIAHFDGRYGSVAIFDGYTLTLIETVAFKPRAYIRIDDSEKGGNATFPELCYGANRHGDTIQWSWSEDPAVIADQFARDCGARLYKTRKKFDAAVAVMKAEDCMADF